MSIETYILPLSSCGESAIGGLDEASFNQPAVCINSEKSVGGLMTDANAAAPSREKEQTYTSSPIRAESASNVGGNDHGTIADFTPGNDVEFIPSSASLTVLQNTETDHTANGYFKIEKNEREKIRVHVRTQKHGATHAVISVQLIVKLTRAPGVSPDAPWPEPLVVRADGHE